MKTFVSDTHPLNADFPIVPTDDGMLISASFEHPSKLLSQMLVTDVGTEIFCNDVQCLNDDLPII